jgi:hypothetical protein
VADGDPLRIGQENTWSNNGTRLTREEGAEPARNAFGLLNRNGSGIDATTRGGPAIIASTEGGDHAIVATATRGHSAIRCLGGGGGLDISVGGTGVFAEVRGTALHGTSTHGTGVHGRGPTGGVFEGGANAGVHAVAVPGAGGLAGRFEGDVEVTGDVRLTGADCAEEFDVVETAIVESGTVMVLGEEGVLRPSYQAYDKRVAGVISGAGDYKPGIVLDKQTSPRKRQPIALLGKVYCKVDAEYAPIEIGDLLTTSPTPGHAMKATDPLKAFGTVIGKALRPVREAQALIPVLVALQ